MDVNSMNAVQQAKAEIRERIVKIIETEGYIDEEGQGVIPSLKVLEAIK